MSAPQFAPRFSTATAYVSATGQPAPVRYAPGLSTIAHKPQQRPGSEGRRAGFAIGPGLHMAQVQPRRDARIHALHGRTMGTSWSLRLANPDYRPMEPVSLLVQQVLQTVIEQMSHWEADSVISQFNASKPEQVHVLPREFALVLDAALHWARLSGGALDPSIGALVSLWGFGPRQNPLAAHAGQLPPVQAIERLRQACGWQRLTWNAKRRELLQPGGLQLDLSGIAKGFAVDEGVRQLQAAGWQGGLFEIGGELRSWGQRPDGHPWRVSLGQGAATEASEGAAPLVVAAEGSLATSGDCWHRFEVDGRSYSHTLDPRTGWPVQQGLASVTVFHAECMHADALATVLTVLGPQQGMAFAQQHGIAALMRPHGSGQSYLASPAWQQLFED